MGAWAEQGRPGALPCFGSWTGVRVPLPVGRQGDIQDGARWSERPTPPPPWLKLLPTPPSTSLLHSELSPLHALAPKPEQPGAVCLKRMAKVAKDLNPRVQKVS